MPLPELRKLSEKSLPHASESALAAVLRDLISSLNHSDYTTSGTAIRRSTHTPQLPARLQALGRRIMSALSRDPLNPPSVPQLAADDPSRQALRFLAASGQVIELDPQVVISAEAYTRAISAVRSHILAHGPATVTQLKQALESTRRVVVPLLERMDKDQVTQRQGDVRTTREDAANSLHHLPLGEVCSFREHVE